MMLWIVLGIFFLALISYFWLMASAFGLHLGVHTPFGHRMWGISHGESFLGLMLSEAPVDHTLQ